jgi:protease-4
MWRALRRQGVRALLMALQRVRQVTGRLPPYGILKVSLAGELSEHQAEPRLLLSFFRPSVDDYCNTLGVLRWARRDPRLRAVLVCCDDLRIGWGRTQELRRLLLSLRQAGKLVWVYLTRAGVREYLLASAADRIVLAPAGTLDITGLSLEVTFLFGALEKLGIEAEIVQMGRYKSMGETFTRRNMSEPHRAMIESLVDDLYTQLVDAITAGRNMGGDEARERLDRGPFLGREALAERLVDALAYEDEAETALRRACDDAKVIDFRDYFVRRGREVRAEVLRQGRGSLAMLSLAGTVKMGDSVSGPQGAAACGAASVARDLKEVRERKDIKAVVLRVSSPGGSGLASDLIWREVSRTREVKPVVVSLGDVAASGGYYVGVAGSPIFAEGGTLTGSIGVVAGKANLNGLYGRVGITKETVSRGRHAALHSSYIPLTDEDRERLRVQAEGFYREFVAKVAGGRKLSEQAVDEAGEGRVWTGRQAWARGLVDQLGGLEQALDEARRLVGIPEGEMVAVERYPKPRRLFRLSFGRSRPPGQLSELLAQASSWQFLVSERLWAILPLHFRFF